MRIPILEKRIRQLFTDRGIPIHYNDEQADLAIAHGTAMQAQESSKSVQPRPNQRAGLQKHRNGHSVQFLSYKPVKPAADDFYEHDDPDDPSQDNQISGPFASKSLSSPLPNIAAKEADDHLVEDPETDEDQEDLP